MTLAQGNGIQLSLSQRNQMLRRVEMGEAVSTDDFSPFFMGQFKAVFLINRLPDVKIRGLGIKDESVEIKDKGFDLQGWFTGHRRRIIPEGRACYTRICHCEEDEI